MSYAIFDHLAGIGVVDNVVIQRGGGSWSEGVSSDLQPPIRHLQKLVVDQERGRRGRGSISGAVHYDGRGDVGDGVAREDGCTAGCQC